MRALILSVVLLTISSVEAQERAPRPAPSAATEDAGATDAATGAEDPAEEAPAEAEESAETEAPPVEHFTLENGLEVFLHADPRSSQVAVCTVYDVGSRDDPVGYRGLAHLMEHMAFRGSENAPEGYLQLLDTLGASSYNGVTSDDDVRYYSVVPSRRLDAALWIEADRMAYLLTGSTQTQLEDEQAIVMHEWRERGGGGSWAHMRQTLREEFYPEGHPYRDTRDIPEDVRAVHLDDIRWHFQRYYQPNNAHLAVVGRFDASDVHAQIEEAFGPIRTRGPEVRRRTAEPVRLHGETIIHMEGSVGRDRVIISWPSPAFLAPGDAELDVVAKLLAPALDDALVDTRIANRVSIGQSSQNLGSTFTIEVSGNIDHSVSEILPLIDEEIGKLRGEPATERAVQNIIADLQRAYLGGEDAMSWRACGLAAVRPPGGAFFDVPYNQRRYADITVADVQRAAETYLNPARRVLTLLENDREAGDLEVESIEHRPAGAR